MKYLYWQKAHKVSSKALRQLPRNLVVKTKTKTKNIKFCFDSKLRSFEAVVRAVRVVVT